MDGTPTHPISIFREDTGPDVDEPAPPGCVYTTGPDDTLILGWNMTAYGTPAFSGTTKRYRVEEHDGELVLVRLA